MAEEHQQQRWHDFPSFVRYVRDACDRRDLPPPSLPDLEDDYVHRCGELARLRAHEEVQQHRQATRLAGRSLGVVE